MVEKGSGRRKWVVIELLFFLLEVVVFHCFGSVVVVISSPNAHSAVVDKAPFSQSFILGKMRKLNKMNY